MKKILAGAMGGAAALTVIFGAGVAVADNEYKGLTYAQVQERTGNRAVIASRTGSYLPTEECIVTGNRRTSFLDSSGNGSAKILVDLNCNDIMTAGHPGYSAATELGKKAEQLRASAKSINKNFVESSEKGTVPYCGDTESRTANCISICKQSGLCTDELLNYLGL